MLPFDFTAPAFDAPLVPAHDDWPVFDAVYFCSLTDDDQTPSPPPKSDALPSPAALAAMPIPPSRASPRNKDPNHIPRPRNAFMLFRSAFAAAQKISAKIEHDNRHITRIIAHCWNSLSDADKQVWRDKAAAEKAQHAARYPDYRFSPIGRANKPVKRNVRRNGAKDVKRCEKLAELVMAGKCGQELESAIKKIDNELRSAERQPADADASASPTKNWDVGSVEMAPFRSPLLPPAHTALPQTPGGLMLQTPVRVTAAYDVEPQALYNNLESDLFGPRFEYHLLTEALSPASLPPAGHFQPTDLAQGSPVQPVQPVLNYHLFPWNQSDGFSYYNC